MATELPPRRTIDRRCHHNRCQQPLPPPPPQPRAAVPPSATTPAVTDGNKNGSGGSSNTMAMETRTMIDRYHNRLRYQQAAQPLPPPPPATLDAATATTRMDNANDKNENNNNDHDATALQALAFAVAALQDMPPHATTATATTTTKTATTTTKTATEEATFSSNYKDQEEEDYEDYGGEDDASHHDNEENHGEDDAQQTQQSRLQRNRARNREHARRTRLRKKAFLQNLQATVAQLQSEQSALKQQLQDRTIASILLNLGNCGGSSGGGTKHPDDTTTTGSGTDAAAGAAAQQLLLLETPMTTLEEQRDDDQDVGTKKAKTGKRRKRSYEIGPVAGHINTTTTTAMMTLEVDGIQVFGGKHTTTSGRNSGGHGHHNHINWKTGVYTDHTTGKQCQLTTKQLETLRRERNRMHAKMTRDRKKHFIAQTERTIEELQRDIARMRKLLQNQNDATTTACITNTSTAATPELTPLPAPTSSSSTTTNNNKTGCCSANNDPSSLSSSNKRVCHGFSLDG